MMTTTRMTHCSSTRLLVPPPRGFPHKFGDADVARALTRQFELEKRERALRKVRAALDAEHATRVEVGSKSSFSERCR